MAADGHSCVVQFEPGALQRAGEPDDRWLHLILAAPPRRTQVRSGSFSYCAAVGDFMRVQRNPRTTDQPPAAKSRHPLPFGGMAGCWCDPARSIKFNNYNQFRLAKRPCLRLR
jgi:hypothetical protein